MSINPGIYALSAPGDTTDFQITTPALLEGTWLRDLDGIRQLSVQLRFLYGSGSGGVRAFLQSSIDQGFSVYDVAIADFAAVARRVVFSVVPTTSSKLIEPSQDGVTGDSPDVAEGIVAPVLGSLLRLHLIVTGSYVNTTLTARVMVS